MKYYGITKISFEKQIESIYCGLIENNKISNFQSHDRNWFVNELKRGSVFYKLIRNKEGKLCIYADSIKYDNNKNKISLGGEGAKKLPRNITKRKTFLSYYHKDDQAYKQYFENLFGDLIVNKSVQEGDIKSDNSDDYIKKLIQDGYLSDTTVLVVLLGKNTKHRKHVDWEISGALNYKVGDHYAGILGVVLPTHPDYGKPKLQLNSNNFPVRFWENYQSGYAVMVDWTENRYIMQKKIEEAFRRREMTDKRRNNILQKKRNTGK